MKVTIVAEKPSVARCIAPFARRHWPDAHLSFINANPYGNFKFAYPRGISWADYPLISEPRHKLTAWAEWHCAPVAYGTGDTLETIAMSPDLLSDADLIVHACDPDHTGAVSFAILMETIFGDQRALDCPTLNLYAIDDQSILKGLAETRSFGEIFAATLDYGRVKRYFDWNWNVNALAILGETARRVGVPNDAPPVSKYALQLLYGLNKRQPMKEGHIMSLMDKWQGTGRYDRTKGFDYWPPALGSCASRLDIVENLIKAELLEYVERVIHLSDKGKAFLTALHPDCEDADLPFRLDAWGQQGITAAKPAIDRYIRTFFGKQKRFLDITAK